MTTLVDQVLQQLTAQQSEAVEVAALRIANPPEAIGLFDIRRPAGPDPDELIKDRFLCRGGGLLLCGQTGAGKSSFNMQLLILWALGKACFGMEPVRPLKSLLIQAENDLIDLAEFRDGVVKGLGLTDEEIASVRDRIIVVRENARTSASFFEQTVRPLLREHRPDLLWIDPALAYLGGESNSQKDVGGFLRNQLNPLLTEFRCAVVVVHHGNKPPSGQERPAWKAGDFAYLGGGSAEWANWARAVIVIRSIGHEEIYELRAAKRGRRLHWKDESSMSTYRKHIAWSTDPQLIFWREPTKDELADLESETKGGRPRQFDPVELLRFVAENENHNQQYYKSKAAEPLRCKSTTIQNALAALVEKEWLEIEKQRRENLYRVAKEGRKVLSRITSGVKTDHQEQEGLF